MAKRLLAIFLALTLLLGVCPVGISAQAAPLTEADYTSVDALFDSIDAMEASHQKRSVSQSQITDAVQALVEDSSDYVPGSLVRNGDAFTWMTVQGIRCAYNPRLQKIHEDTPDSGEDRIANEPSATRGGWPTGNQVYLVGPYYGYDSDFTDQYKNEATRIASAIGDTDGYTLYSGKSATVDKVAEAVSKGAVVIFDSHGTTDYENGYDYVTGATSSYLCLTSTTGLTQADYADGALYYSDGICINGATIANHMTSNSPAGLLWMAICLGMATDTMCAPLREKGVEVVYGYSQSVTFAGDYLFEETFWENMREGATVAEAVADMKNTWGNWDWSTQIAEYYYYDDGYSTISAARADYSAFPVVVSDEDTHPGQRSGRTFYGADSLQTVRSTYTLFSQYQITATSSNTAHGTVSVNGKTVTATPATGYFAQGYTLLSGSATVTQNGNTFQVQAASDCAIQINFAAKTPVRVTFSGATAPAQNGYSGDPMTLPAATAPEGFTFLGWTTAPLTEVTTEAPDYYTATFTPTGNTTLYALYSYVDESTSTGSGDYVKVTQTPGDWSGTYLIVYEDAGYIFDGSLTTFDGTSNYQAVTISNHTISAAQGDDYCFTISPSGNGYAIEGISGKYIGHSSNSNGLTTSATALVNRLSLTSGGDANIIGTGGAYLRFNNTSGQNRFRYYKSSTYSNQQPIALYRKDGAAGVTCYTSSTTACIHPSVENGVCSQCGAALAARTAAGLWTSVQQAAENAPDGHVQLLADSGETVSADTLYLDLNGHTLAGVTVTTALYGYDTSATTETEGSGSILSVTGPVVMDHTAESTRYIALNQGGSYHFHVLQLALDTVVFRSSAAGLYYQASLCCDETLRAAIGSHGIALSVVDMPGIDYWESHNLYTQAQGAPSEAFPSVVVSDIFTAGASDNGVRGKQPVYANAYLQLQGGTVILSDNTNYDKVTDAGFDGVAVSLYDVMITLDQNFSLLSASQQATVQQFAQTWRDALADWNLDNLA